MIGIFEFGGGLRSRDLEQFCNDVGVSVPKVKVVSVDDTPQDPNDLNVSGEVMLDVEVIAGACPAPRRLSTSARRNSTKRPGSTSWVWPSTTTITSHSSSQSAMG